jgi:hypothetical protein
MSEQEWQPARFIAVHFTEKDALEYSGDPGLRDSGPLIHVRQTQLTLKNLTFYRERGCNAERFFDVREEPGSIVCEHEILTD